MTYTKQDPTTIQALFNDIAPRYETGNALLSFNLHRLWNKALIRKALTETKPQNYLDLCAGTGDISLGY
ncbi:MAG: class I SAM-dependent methyltransferase, partial [Chlamydiia bacterium]|nr:class I SAM-dependent methyltransferase [Chlamydiia bacterium]